MGVWHSCGACNRAAPRKHFSPVRVLLSSSCRQALHEQCLWAKTPAHVWGLQARARKVDAGSKLEQLQRDIAELSSLSPEAVQAEEAGIAAIEEVRHDLFLLM